MSIKTDNIQAEELTRLTAAYASIRSASIRAEFLTAIESWAVEQWRGAENPFA